MKPKLSILVAAALLGIASAAHAVGETWTASFSNLQFQIVDLDPTDGITAGMSINDFPIDASVNLHGYQAFGGPYTSPSVSLTSGGSSASVWVPATGLAGATSSSVIKTSTNFTDFASTRLDANITLTPHTQLILTGDALIDQKAGRNGNAYVELEVNGRYVDSDLTTTSAEVFRSNAGTTSQQLVASFTNLAGASITTGFIIRTEVNAVPEPASPALLLAGLGLMGAVARRRRSR